MPISCLFVSLEFKNHVDSIKVNAGVKNYITHNNSILIVKRISKNIAITFNKTYI